MRVSSLKRFFVESKLLTSKNKFQIEKELMPKHRRKGAKEQALIFPGRLSRKEILLDTSSENSVAMQGGILI